MIPTFPSDATISSIHLAFLRAGNGQSLKSSVREVYGLNGSIHNCFGYKANSLIGRTLAGAIDPKELIDRHSMFPLVACIVTPHISERWRHVLATGNADELRRFLAPSQHGIKKRDVLRQCPKCVHQDREIFGTGHWHVMHQLPAIRFCKIHGDLLHDQCSRCGSAFGSPSDLALPGEPCARCGSVKTASSLTAKRSKGYNSFADLVARAFQGNAPELAPGIRTLLVQKIIATSNGDAKTLLASFLATWEVDNLQHLEKLLQYRTSYHAALQFFTEGVAQVSLPFLLAAIAFAWEHIAESDRRHLLLLEMAEIDVSSIATADVNPIERLREELNSLAHIHHLPSEVVEQLACGNRGQASALIGGTNVFLLLDGLSPASRAQIETGFAQFRSRIAVKTHPRRESQRSNSYEKIQVLRQKILAFIAAGCNSRSDLKRKNATLYQTALLTDRAWLDEVMPSSHRIHRLSHRANVATKRSHYRAIILQAKKNGSSTRTELRRVCSGAINFAIRNDRKWFDLVVGPKLAHRSTSISPTLPTRRSTC